MDRYDVMDKIYEKMTEAFRKVMSAEFATYDNNKKCYDYYTGDTGSIIKKEDGWTGGEWHWDSYDDYQYNFKYDSPAASGYFKDKDLEAFYEECKENEENEMRESDEYIAYRDEVHEEDYRQHVRVSDYYQTYEDFVNEQLDEMLYRVDDYFCLSRRFCITLDYDLGWISFDIDEYLENDDGYTIRHEPLFSETMYFDYEDIGDEDNYEEGEMTEKSVNKLTDFMERAMRASF